MSFDLPGLGDRWPGILGYDPVMGTYIRTRLPKSPASSPQTSCNCDLPVKQTRKTIKITIDLQEYKPEAIEIKKATIKNVPYLIIEVKKKEENGIVYRYPLPEGVTLQDFIRDLSLTGTLPPTTSKKEVPADTRKHVSPSRVGSGQASRFQ